MYNLLKYLKMINPLKYIKKLGYRQKQDRYHLEAVEHNRRAKERQDRYYLQVLEHNQRVEGIRHAEGYQKKHVSRRIYTVRSTDSVDYNIEGYKPLIKKLVPSDVFNLLHMVTKDRKTGRISYIADTSGGWWDSGSDTIGEEYRYAYDFESDHAAYMVPLGIQVGQRVMLDNLIEDYVGGYCNGIPYRLRECEAVWNGEDFDIDYDSVIVETDGWSMG